MQNLLNGEDVTMSRYMKDVGRNDVLSAEEEAFLLNRCKDGCSWSRDKLIVCNLRLVTKIARFYANRLSVSMNLLDLISEGNIGLMKAIDKFDCTSGNRLSTYAVWWIKESIEISIMNLGRTVRVPIHRLKLANKISRLMRRRSENKPINHIMIQELALELRVTEQDIRDSMSIVDLGVNLSATSEYCSYSIDDIQSESITCPLDTLCDIALAKEIRCQIDTLPDREKAAVSSRYSVITGKDSVTNFKELGHELGVSIERARQINNLGIERLKLRLKDRGWGVN
ncbi:sigma-70 family RNA polymerase sigma factor [Vibrio mediterranei]